MNTSDYRLLGNKVVCVSSVKSEIYHWHKARSESFFAFSLIARYKIKHSPPRPTFHLPESMKPPNIHGNPLKNEPKVTVTLQTTYLLWCKRENSLLHRLRERLIEFLCHLTFSTPSVDCMCTQWTCWCCSLKLVRLHTTVCQIVYAIEECHEWHLNKLRSKFLALYWETSLLTLQHKGHAGKKLSHHHLDSSFEV